MCLAALTIGGGAIWINSATADNQKFPRYSHSNHEKLKVNHNNCRQCHVLDDQYDVLAATLGKGHKPCNNENCHASEFFSKEPKMCFVCHDDVDPNIKQAPVVRRHKKSEFGGDLSHESHTKKVKSAGGKNGACVTCHGDVFKGDKPTQSGHASCSGCHGKRGSEPSMGTCSGCHKLGAKKARSSTDGGDWSVSGMFTHTSHGNDPRARKTETSCLECHSTIGNAKNLNEIENPAMSTCDGCHNGKNAFKTTGFGCYNCHGDGGSDK
jgi:hypothetical protein